MSIENIEPKDLLTVAGPFIKSIVDVFVTPKLENIRKKYSSENQKLSIPTKDHFSEYFYRTYKRLSTINTLVFSNSQKLIKEIYIPLTIKINDNSNRKYKVEAYPEDVTRSYQKILVTDTAGMGKSTLMKRIFIDVIDMKRGIPILIELRRLSREKTILDEVGEQLNSVDKEIDKQLMREFISEGEFIFILDGYDEISLSEKEHVTKDIQSFISKSCENIFFLTSRPESALKSFGDFVEFTIEPLKKKEAYELLRKYDSKSHLATHLIKKLEETNLSNISEFLTNPLLVSLLFTAFEYKQVIPFKKHIFYRQVYEANFESHDLTKGDSYMHEKHSSLDIDDFHKVLRFVGFECLKLQKIEFTKDELLHVISKAKTFCTGLAFSPSDFVKDLLTTVPIFTQDGIYIRWSHKSLQEYFAAQFIYLDSKEKQKDILSRIYNSLYLDNFKNLLDIYYDVDYKSFRNVIIKNLIDDYHNYISNCYLSIDASIPKECVDLRRSLTFLNKFILLNNSFSFGDNIEKLLDKIELELSLSIDEKYVTVLHVSNEFAIARFTTKHINILEILHNRKNRLVTKHPINPDLHYPDTKFSHDLHLIDDLPLNIHNLPENFSIFNDILMDSLRISSSISTEESIRLKEEIESEISEEDKRDSLLIGI